MNLRLSCLALFLSFAAYSQQPHTLWFHSLGAQQGLSQSYNWYVYHDTEGFVWISSIAGLNRFDGVNVKRYSSIPGDTTSLLGENIYGNFFEDKNQDIWFSTSQAIHCYRRRTDNFQRFFLRDDKDQSIQGVYKTHFLEKDSLLWVSVDGAIYRVNIHRPREPAKKVAQTTQFRCRMELDADGAVRRLFAYGIPGGIEIYEIKNGEPVGGSENPDGIRVFFPETLIREAFPESDTLIWLSVDKYGLVALNPSQNTWRIWGDFASGSFSFIPWGKDRLILASMSKGVFIIDKKDESIIQVATRFINGNEGAAKGFKELYLDRDENLWVSDESAGLHFAGMNKVKFRSLPKIPAADGNKNYSYWAFAEDKNDQIWASSSYGVFLLDKKGRLLRHYTRNPDDPKSLPYDWVRDIAIDKDNEVWLTTVNGVARYHQGDNGFSVVSPEKRKRDFIANHLRITRDHKLLVSSEGAGIFEMKETQGKKYLASLLPPSTGEYQTIFEDSRGNLYCPRNSREVCVFQFQGDGLKLIDSLPVVGLVNGFYEDENNGALYFATSNGLVKIEKSNPDAAPVIFTEVDGLPGKFIGEMLADEKGNLWLGTNRGLAFFDKSEKAFRSFSLADGVQSWEFHINAAMKRRNGELWFGGSEGVTIAPYSGDIRNVETPPKVLITGIKINDEEPDSLRCLETGATNVARIRRIELPYRQKTLSFEFVAVEYSDPANNRLRYKLEGSDDKWVEIEKGKPGFARYSKLSHGDYAFRLQAANSDGIWNEPREMIRITINPPWFLTWWFKTLAGLSVLGLLLWLVQNHIARIRRKEETLRKEAEFRQKEAEFRQREAEAKQQMAETETAILRLQMNPHFIYNSMNSINAYILNKDIDTAGDYLNRFAKLMRMILDFAKKPYITLYDEIQLLEQYLLTEAMRFEGQFSFSFEVDDSIDQDDVIVPTMILQPFVENAVWHGLSQKKGDGCVKIGFKIEEESLVCSVEDNGIGREAAGRVKNRSPVHESKALAITRQRLELLKAKTGARADCEIVDLKDANGQAMGTKVLLHLPLFA
jgi:ligand-binding sensor domain-containing protein/signal transduction histidine kinase